MGKKRLDYDDDALVEMISEGQMTYKAIGEKLGISEALVKLIAQGRRRKELGQKFWDAENGILAEARRIATQYARHMLMEQIRLGLRGEGEPARRAREYVLKFAAAGRPRRKDVPGEQERRPEWMLQLARETGPTPWEDELDAEREREAVEEEARKREGLTAENAESAEGEGGNRERGTGNGERGTGKGRTVVTAASMPTTGVFPGPAGPGGAARPEAASMPATGVACDGR